jgi:hypothetical protein
MPSTDQTHLRKYFATLGVAVAAGTLSLAGLFLKLEQDLLVTQSTLAKLTPTARDALLRRQEYLSFGTHVLPWFILAGFLGGIGLSAYGLVGWAKRQKVLDERENIGLQKEREEYRQLTATETAKKLDRDAQESVSEAKESVTEESSTSTGTSPDSPANIREVLNEISSCQLNLIEKLSGIYGSDADILAPVSLGTVWGENNREVIEASAAVMRPVGPIIFELRYASAELARASSPTLDKLLQIALAAKALKSRAVLMVVVSDDTAPSQIVNWTEYVKQIAEAHHSVLGFYVGKYSDFIALSAGDFAAQVGLDYKTSSGFTPYMESGNRWEPLNPDLDGLTVVPWQSAHPRPSAWSARVPSTCARTRPSSDLVLYGAVVHAVTLSLLPLGSLAAL